MSEQICHHSRMAAISIGKRVYGDQPVMKSQYGLIDGFAKIG
jgi:hypothetical protein